MTRSHAMILAAVLQVALLPGPALAGGGMRRAPTLSAAQALARKVQGDILVIVTGSDWNEASRRFKAEVVESPVFQTAFGSEVILVEIDRPENDPGGKRAASYQGANDLRRFVFRVPLIGLYDAQGRDIGQLTAGLEKLSAEPVVENIQMLLRQRRERDRLLQAASTAQSVKKADLLGHALASIGVGWTASDHYAPRREDYQAIVDELKKADQSDSTGWVARFQFDPYRLLSEAEESCKKHQHAEAVARADALLRNPKFPSEYRQRTLAVKYAVYSRWQGHEGDAMATLKQIEQIDSQSLMGIGARGWVAYLTGPVDLVHGWRKQNVSADFQVWTIPLDEVVKEPGFYRLTLQRAWNHGNNNILVGAIAIEVGGKRVWSFNKPSRPTIEELIELPGAGQGKCVLKIQAKGDGGTDSFGSIKLEPFYSRRTKR